jgi:hypothetical protein
VTLLLRKRVDAAIGPSVSDPGEFDLILSNGALDRDGEKLHLADWAQPLPTTVPINVNHSNDVSDIVGSGEPFFDSEGNLRVTGKFASTPQAQHIRSLVNEGHLTSVSVEFLRTKDGNVLVGGAFVNVPANPEARVLASKALDDFEVRLDRILAGQLVAKAVADSADGMAMITAIHDASVHLGAQCVEMVDSDDGASDGANKAMALRLRLKSICA